MVEKTSYCAQQHRFCPHHVLDNFITFHLRAPGRKHIVSAPFEAMEIPCFVNEHWGSSCPLQLCLGHKQAHTQAQAHSSSPKFLFLSLLSFSSVIMLFKKKYSIISNFHWKFLTHIVIFLQNNYGKGPVSISLVHSPLTAHF